MKRGQIKRHQLLWIFLSLIIITLFAVSLSYRLHDSILENDALPPALTGEAS